MALRVLQATSRAGGAVAVSASRAAASAGSVRFFSDAVADEDEAAKLAKIAAENALMEKLQQQQFADADISVMPFHAGPRAAVVVDDAPLPFPAETALVSGTDKWTGGRKVRILKPARHQMQSGTYNTKHWEIRFESARTWENPLMGWTSSKDPLVPQVYKFDTQEEAVAFAEKQGWEMEIKEPAPVGDFGGKISYSHNFLPEDIENLIKREGKKSHVQFRHPTGRRSNWVKTLKYHGNGVVAQHGGEAKN